MTAVVISWPDVTGRYEELEKLRNATSPEVQDRLMTLAEASIHGRLSNGFTVPFSSNNFTARDLCIDELYVQNMMTKQPEKAKAVRDSLDKRIEQLLLGNANMIDSGGAVLLSLVSDTVWSNTSGYAPTFGVGDIVDARVSSAQLYDEAQARGDYNAG